VNSVRVAGGGPPLKEVQEDEVLESFVRFLRVSGLEVSLVEKPDRCTAAERTFAEVTSGSSEVPADPLRLSLTLSLTWDESQSQLAYDHRRHSMVLASPAPSEEFSSRSDRTSYREMTSSTNFPSWRTLANLSTNSYKRPLTLVRLS
jgi:hypothetical protein